MAIETYEALVRAPEIRMNQGEELTVEVNAKDFTGVNQENLKYKTSLLKISEFGNPDNSVLHTITGKRNAQYASILLPFDGADESTTITDIGYDAIFESPFTWTASGNAKLQTATKKIGTASLYMAEATDFITSTEKFIILGYDNWKLETWVYFTEDETITLLLVDDGADNIFQIDAFTYGIRLYIEIDSTVVTEIFGGNSSTSVSLNTWHHFVVERDDNDIRVFIDGNIQKTILADGAKMSSEIYIPYIDDFVITGAPTGEIYLDDLMFVTGVADRKDNFTPLVVPQTSPSCYNVFFDITSDISSTLAGKYCAEISIGDAGDKYTKALNHFNGVHGSFVIQDELGGVPILITGGRSADDGFDPATVPKILDLGILTDDEYIGKGLYVPELTEMVVPSLNAFNMGMLDFTLEARVSVESEPAVTNYTLFGIQNAYSYIEIFIDPDDSKLKFEWETQDGDEVGTGEADLGDLNDGDFHHVALVRNNNDCILFVDGISLTITGDNWSVADFGVDDDDLTSFYYFGSVEDAGIIVDEFRLSVGIARWTSDFTPLDTLVSIEDDVHEEVFKTHSTLLVFPSGT